jgi:hypothetical protein
MLSMESRVHNVVGLPGYCDTEPGRKQLRASILCARECMLDVLDGRIDVEDPPRTALKLNERIFRFCMRDHHAKSSFVRKASILARPWSTTLASRPRSARSGCHR